MRRLIAMLAALLVAGCAGVGGTKQDKVVYHINEGMAQASNGLRNINNHLEVNADAKIVVVTHALGVDFLMKGAKDKNGNKYEDLVERLKQRGVQFDVCQITLRNRKLSKEQRSPRSRGCSSARAMLICGRNKIRVLVFLLEQEEANASAT